MVIVEEVLLAQRTTDGLFLMLREDRNTTDFGYTDEPEKAKRITPYNKEELFNPKEAPYYFENSWRAKELWLKDCVMVGYKIETGIIATKLAKNSK